MSNTKVPQYLGRTPPSQPLNEQRGWPSGPLSLCDYWWANIGQADCFRLSIGYCFTCVNRTLLNEVYEHFERALFVTTNHVYLWHVAFSLVGFRLFPSAIKTVSHGFLKMSSLFFNFLWSPEFLWMFIMSLKRTNRTSRNSQLNCYISIRHSLT